ncbi:MAG: KH domain-containing protein [Myxococcota bacterium]
MSEQTELVVFMARALVAEPEAVRVRDVGDQVLELEVASDDLGRVIGRRGKTARAMRAALAASAGGAGYDLEIAED